MLVGADQADVIGRGPIDVDVDGGAVRAQRHRHGIGDVEVGVDVHHAAVAREHHRAADGDRSAGATGDVAGVVEVGARPGAGDHLDLEVEAGGVVRPGHLRLVTGLVVDLKVRVGGAARGSCRDQRGGSTLAAETAGGDRRRLRAAAEAQCLLHAARARSDGCCRHLIGIGQSRAQIYGRHVPGGGGVADAAADGLQADRSLRVGGCRAHPELGLGGGRLDLRRRHDRGLAAACSGSDGCCNQNPSHFVWLPGEVCLKAKADCQEDATKVPLVT